MALRIENRSGHQTDGLAETGKRQNEEDAAGRGQGENLRPEDAENRASFDQEIAQTGSIDSVIQMLIDKNSKRATNDKS
ncbi:MAG: hypothetical protein WC685_04055 [Methylobacter sp.]|jgi:hypothetical protein